jgi:signal recognition particle subunit SRP68
LERLHQFPRPGTIDIENLVKWPPKLQPVPVKPFFFDIAYNYIGLEAKEGEVKKEVVKTKVEEKKPEPAKKGWFWRS